MINELIVVFVYKLYSIHKKMNDLMNEVYFKSFRFNLTCYSDRCVISLKSPHIRNQNFVKVLKFLHSIED